MMDDQTVTQSDDPDLFLRVLRETVEALESRGIAHAAFGGIASVVHGRPSNTRDIDILVRPQDAGAALEALAEAGFETEETNPAWIYKATRNGVLVDLIFRVKGEIYLNEEMLSRRVEGEYEGQRVVLVSPEDALLIEAVSTEDETPGHWYNALAIVARGELDWDYLVHRALQHGTRRVLSLLFFAQSRDLVVPPGAIRALYEAVLPQEATR